MQFYRLLSGHRPQAYSGCALKIRKDAILEESVTLLRKRILILAQTNNLSSKELETLRAQLAQHKVSAKWLKTSIFRKAVKETPYAALEPALSGPVLAISSEEEPGTVGRAILSSTSSKDLFILAGKVEERVWTHEGCNDVLKNLQLATQLQKSLVSLLSRPASALLGALQEAPAILTAILKQKPESPFASSS